MVLGRQQCGSNFTPVVTFRLWEKFSDACLGIGKYGSEWKENLRI